VSRVPDDRLPTLSPARASDGLESLVAVAARFALQHPMAAQALFTALVAEGRRVSETPDGQRLRAALADSELVRRGRVLWERSPLALLEDAPDVVLPAGLRDALTRLLAGDPAPETRSRPRASRRPLLVAEERRS
jgi:hypothetical protein